jgi:membrane-bound lytic murein transglycosylase A
MVHQTMKINRPAAANASMMRSHMGSSCHAALGLAMLAALAGCGALQTPAPVEQRAPGAASAELAAAAPAPAAAATPPAAPPAMASVPPSAARGAAADRARARWVAATWADLPGWSADRAAEAWPALQTGCTRPAAGWNELCARVLLSPAPAGDEAMRRWLTTHLQPWRVEAADGQLEGLATGYFEPLIDAVRRPRGSFRVPLHALPPSRPTFTRQQFDTQPAAMAALKGHEIVWIEDPMDALMLQVQGSGRLRITDADGRVSTVRLAYAGHNEQPYKSVGRWLIEQGELTPETASWPAIKAWAQKNPRRVPELLWANPRVVFFREEPLPDPAVGPRGSLGVPLTPMRSVAVDPQAVPLGTLLWLDTTEPLSATPLRRLVAAQDTGSAIVGAVRIDLFFGWQAGAEGLAGRMKQPLRLWALWPKGALPPTDAP